MTKKTSPAYRASKEETIPINKLHPFSNHPFHIRHDLEFSELVDSMPMASTMTRQRSSLWQRYITSRIGRVRSLCLLSATMCLLQNSAEHWQRMAWM